MRGSQKDRNWIKLMNGQVKRRQHPSRRLLPAEKWIYDAATTLMTSTYQFKCGATFFFWNCWIWEFSFSLFYNRIHRLWNGRYIFILQLCQWPIERLYSFTTTGFNGGSMASLSMRMCGCQSGLSRPLSACAPAKKEYINNCCCHPICIDDMLNAHDTRENEASLKGKGGGNDEQFTPRHLFEFKFRWGGENRKTFHSAIFPFIVNLRIAGDNWQRSCSLSWFQILSSFLAPIFSSTIVIIIRFDIVVQRKSRQLFRCGIESLYNKLFSNKMKNSRRISIVSMWPSRFSLATTFSLSPWSNLQRCTKTSVYYPILSISSRERERE